MTRQAKTRTHRLARLTRGLWPDHNPLRRRSDRAEAAIVAALLATFLAGAPLTVLAVGGLAVGGLAHGVSHSARPARDGGPRLSTGGQAGGAGESSPDIWALWRPRDVIRAASKDRAVTKTTASQERTSGGAANLTGKEPGRRSGPPQPGTAGAVKATLLSSLAVIVLAVLLLGAGLAARRVLDRRRLAAWECDWAVTEPRWTGQR